jgi:SH3-like domain-containing protein
MARPSAASFLLAIGLATQVQALDFRSVAPESAVLYDAPSAKATPLFVVNRGYPVEVIITLQNWVKVRDPDGQLAWIEDKNLSAQRTVVVIADEAVVRTAASDEGEAVFRAAKGLQLEWLGEQGIWRKVRHRDGMTGFIRLDQIWGG